MARRAPQRLLRGSPEAPERLLRDLSFRVTRVDDGDDDDDDGV